VTICSDLFSTTEPGQLVHPHQDQEPLLMSNPLACIPLCCPLDGRALKLAEHGLACSKGHNYNISRHGYVNLLPARLKPSKDPGDSRSMVEARSLVLGSGLFDVLSSALLGLLVEKLSQLNQSAESVLLVDAGCGNGHYTDRMRIALSKANGFIEIPVLGVDISKWAVTAAAKKFKACAWAVGNNKRLPVINGSASIITSLFGFETWHPWADLQKRGQLVVTVSPDTQHLLELRERVYEEVRMHGVADDSAAIAAGYERIEEHAVNTIGSVANTAIAQALLSMTPHSHRMSSEASANLDLSGLNSVTVAARIRVYRRL